MFKIILSLLLCGSLYSKDLKDMISNMFIIGFDGHTIPLELKEYIKNRELGGVILFSKNIKDKKSLIRLTKSLQQNSKSTLLISIDQEGGLVERLKEKDGFLHTIRASKMSLKTKEYANKAYLKMAKMLKNVGINTNFAPSVDLALNPKNSVIVKYGRSFSSDPNVVIKYASIFMNEMQKQGILSVIKHFPGHGSSIDDSHKGFVDVSDTWTQKELEPFFALHPKAIMSAHIYNTHLDDKYPATLSYNTLNILRDKGFDGIIISDDLQMGAISQNYDLNMTLTLAINAGIDMLLFGNQLSHPIKIQELVKRVEALVMSGKIDINKIKNANKNIDNIKGFIDDR